ncbi:THAP domain-containing protein 1-like isoform X2 [Bombyx mandarina]|uniref:THAP-type domain-containing protein n=2 Tax=Bombyx TaxID=7090 RepID=A0A8R1WMY4_BOMMO|nr:THAP domain-containing protein 1 [Bombyx mori]XP_004930708.1 THAP domain-containing protein 1 [Bombyx mori]XP_028041762.1 THAP domain-containing protein 1-like isoform X2 [Bombyx mandarina]
MNINLVYKMKDSLADFNDNKTKPTPIAKVAPELKQNADTDMGITKTCAVLGCDDCKNMDSIMFFRFPEDSSLRQIWTDLTGRNNWTPTDFSYICIQHFSVDCFKLDNEDRMVLVDKAVPSLKLPRHVLEVEYIDEDTLDNEGDNYIQTESDEEPERPKKIMKTITYKEPDIELLKLFSEVQRMQRLAVTLKQKLKHNMRIHNKQNRFLLRIREIIEMKKKILNQKRKKKCRILLSLQDKIKEDTSGLVLAMPMRQTEDLKNFALSVYKYSPQAYIYIRNTLRTMLPSTEILESWVTAGYQPKNVASNMIKVVAEQTETSLSCKVTLG